MLLTIWHRESQFKINENLLLFFCDKSDLELSCFIIVQRHVLQLQFESTLFPVLEPTNSASDQLVNIYKLRSQGIRILIITDF